MGRYATPKNLECESSAVEDGLNEHQTSQTGNRQHPESLPGQGRAGKLPHPPGPPAARSPDGPPRRGQNPDHGAGGRRDRRGPGGLHHHPPHPPERRGPALH